MVNGFTWKTNLQWTILEKQREVDTQHTLGLGWENFRWIYNELRNDPNRYLIKLLSYEMLVRKGNVRIHPTGHFLSESRPSG